MGNFVESRVVAGTPPIGSGWAAPAPVAGDRLAEGRRPALGQRKACTAEFVREVGRAVALQALLGSRRSTLKADQPRSTAQIAEPAFCRHTYVTQRSVHDG